MTLTYGRDYPTSGRLVAKHRNAFLTWLRRKFQVLSYVWFLEFQRRGAPHLHLLLSLPSPGRKLEDETGTRWCKIVAKDYPGTYEKMLKVHCFSGDQKDRMWSDIRERDGANRYMRKYAGKQSQKRKPEAYLDVGRFWGNSRDVKKPVEEMLKCKMSGDDLRALLCAYGRKDIAKWEVLPKFIHLTTK